MKNETKHTLRDLRVEVMSPYVAEVHDQDGIVVDTVSHANARLLSAAPELLDAVKAVADILAHVESYVTNDEYLRKELRRAEGSMRTAIAKAEGRE